MASDKKSGGDKGGKAATIEGHAEEVKKKKRTSPLEFLRQVRVEAEKVTWTSWKVGVLKLALVAFGILIGTSFHEFWQPWTAVLWESLDRARREWDPATRVYPAHYASASEREPDQSVGRPLGRLLEQGPPAHAQRPPTHAKGPGS